MKKAYLRAAIAMIIISLTVYGIHSVLSKSIDLREVFAQLQQFSMTEIALLLLLSTLMMTLRAVRFYLLVKSCDQNLTFWQALKVFITGQLFAVIPAGEGARPILLKEEADIEIKDSVSPLIILGVTEMIVAVIITLIGSIFIATFRVAALIALIGTIGLLWILLNHRVVRLIVAALPSIPSIQKAGDTIIDAQKETRELMFASGSWRPSRAFLQNAAIATVISVLGAVVIYLIARHFLQDGGILFSWYIFSASVVLSELVPFIPGGVGVTEGGMTGILVVSGVSLAQALIIVLVYRVVTLVYGLLLGFIFLILFYGKDYWNTLNQK